MRTTNEKLIEGLEDLLCYNEDIETHIREIEYDLKHLKKLHRDQAKLKWRLMKLLEKEND